MQFHLDVDAKSVQSTLVQVLLKTSAAKACPPFQVALDWLLLAERLVDFEESLLAILAEVVAVSANSSWVCPSPQHS